MPPPTGSITRTGRRRGEVRARRAEDRPLQTASGVRVYLPNGQIFNETLLEEGYAQVATFPPNVKYVDRFLEAQREAREANRGLWGHSADKLCQQSDRGNGIGGGCSGSASESQPEDQWGSSVSGASAGDSNLDCGGFETHEQAQRVLKQDPSDPRYLDGNDDGQACEDLP